MIQINLENPEEILLKDIRTKEERLEAFADKINEINLDCELESLSFKEIEENIHNIAKKHGIDFTTKDLLESVNDGSFYNIGSRSQNIIADEVLKHWSNKNESNETTKLKTMLVLNDPWPDNVDKLITELLDSNDKESLILLSKNDSMKELLSSNDNAYKFIERTIENGKTPFPETVEWAKQFVPDINDKLANDGIILSGYKEVHTYLSDKLNKLSNETIDNLYKYKINIVLNNFSPAKDETKLTCELLNNYGKNYQKDSLVENVINRRRSNVLEAIIIDTDYKMKPEMLEKMKSKPELAHAADLYEKKELNQKLTTSLQPKLQPKRMKI